MRLKKISFSTIIKILISFLAVTLVIQFLGPAVFSTDVFEFEACLKPWGYGRTFIHFPPLGRVIAHTHIPPFDFHFTLKSINLGETLEFAGNFYQTNFQQGKIIQKIKISMIKYFAFLLILSFFLGMAAMFFGRGRDFNKKEILWSGLVSFFVLLIVLSAAVFSYDLNAFSRAEYEGTLEAAPWVLNALQEGIGVVENIGGQFTEIVENISFLQNEIDKTAPLITDKDSKTILHVSDIHNNPAAFDFIRRIVETFDVEVIVDTGDLVDYGTSLEMELFLQHLAAFKTPYVFIPGNHDSPFLIEALKKMENITVLEEDIVEIAGFHIAGIADPASYSTAALVSDDKLMEKTAQKLEKMIRERGNIDIIAAHNPDCFKYLRHNNNTLLAGHLHKPCIKKTDNYLELNAGTTGSSGIRGLKNLEIDFSLILLNFQPLEKEEVYVPFSADLIKVKQFPLNFSFERFLFNDQ
ncbi:MAG: hypothetical protein GX996_05295 [Firmicutes bacterium]|nr:hypothetical protein [Bacillota bacterium]